MRRNVTHQTFFGIQVLRGVAAVAVVSFHLATGLSEHNGFTHLPQFYAGNGGVDLFFLISGFVIVWTTKGIWQVEGAWRGFLTKRVSRVIPLYWLLSATKLVVALSLPFLFRAPPPRLIDILCSFTLLPVWDNANESTLIIAAGWTLCYEMAFYYLVTICLALRWRPLVTAGPMLVILGVAGVFRSTEWGALASLIDPLLLEFVGGMVIAELTRQGKIPRSLAMVVALLSAGTSLWVLSSLLTDAQALQLRVIVWGIPAMLILYGMIGLEPWLNHRKLRLPLLIGDASYSLYLTHALVLQIPVSFLSKLKLPPAGEWTVFLALLALAIACGVLAWRLIERALIHGSINRLKRLSLSREQLDNHRIAPQLDIYPTTRSTRRAPGRQARL